MRGCALFLGLASAVGVVLASAVGVAPRTVQPHPKLHGVALHGQGGAFDFDFKAAVKEYNAVSSNARLKRENFRI
jgi:hypothetical protein